MRRPPLLFPLLVLAACEGSPVPTGPDAPDPSAIVVDATTDGNSHLFFLPPVVGNNAPFTDPPDASLHPRVEVCEWAGGACVDGGVAYTYTTSGGPGGTAVEVSEDHYQVQWDTKLSGIEVGKVFRARIMLFGLELGSVDLQIAENGREVNNLDDDFAIGLVDNRTLPLKFRIEEGALAEAVSDAEGGSEGSICFDEFGGVIDCDVEIVDATQGGSATVFDDPGGMDQTLAAVVTVDPDDAFDENGDPVEQFQLTLQHVAQAPSPDLSTSNQVPFFIDLTAIDADGDPVFFQEGAFVVLCQPPDLSDPSSSPSIPDPLHHSLRMFRVHGGVTELLATGYDEGANCPGGIHGGLNTILRGAFSGFGATLPTAPSLSTAVVPDGTVDIPTVIDVQAKVATAAGALNQIFDGDEVVVTVTGANSATASVTDNGDGTYTAEYTPLVTGTDLVSILIRNVETGVLEPISGSPFTSVVGTQVSLWAGEGSFDDTRGRNDGGPGPLGTVTYDAGIVGQAFRFQRDGAVVGGPGNYIDGLQQLSVAAWVNIDPGSPERAVQRFVTLAGGEKAVIRQNLAPDAGTGRQLHFYMNFGTFASFDLRHLTADGVLQQGCFNYVVGTYDGSTMRLYLNGVELRSQAVSGTVVTGDGFHFSNAPTFEGLEGRLDEAAVYNRALSSAEISALYAAPASGQCAQPIAGEVLSVDVQPISPTVISGTSIALSATPVDAFGDVVTSAPAATWTSTDPAVATVNASGVVTGVAPGEATITATVDGVEGITKVTVVDVLIDGVMSPGEWPGSAFGFAANLPGGGTAPATFHWQVKGGTFYAAVRVARSSLDERNSVSVEFGPDPSGSSAGVRDIFLVNDPNSFVDDVRLPDTTAPTDVSQGGTNDGEGTVANDGTYTVFELAHPLDSADDLYDFSLQSGDVITLQIFLRLINGGQTGDSMVPTPALSITIP